MKKINITYAKDNLYELINEVNTDFNLITIVGDNNKNAVLISEGNWKNIKETLYLSSINGFSSDIKDIRKSENWDNAYEYCLNEEW